MGLIDTHVHLDDEKFDLDRNEIITSLVANGVDLAITCADSMESSYKAAELAAKYKNIYAAVGIHPHNAKNFKPDDISRLEEIISHQKVVAVGEIGLDYHYEFSPREAQKDCMMEHIGLAVKYNMPIVFHVREAYGDFVDIMRGGGIPHNAVVHSYTGSRETAKDFLDYGMMLSFNGVITFKNANRVREMVEYVPIERIMLETDCPYMTPVPHRGKRNEPKYVSHVAQMMAELKKISVEEVIDITKINAIKFFRLNE